jgi:Domain of unknown function (DUF5664)
MKEFHVINDETPQRKDLTISPEPNIRQIKVEDTPKSTELDKILGRKTYTKEELKDWIKPVSDQGQKEATGKLEYELDFEFITQMAERMAQNKGKYPKYNWKNPIDIESLKQALMRHVISVMSGQYENDGREFGHLESVACNIMMINYQLKHNKKD